jgi:hypothetical protein
VPAFAARLACNLKSAIVAKFHNRAVSRSDAPGITCSIHFRQATHLLRRPAAVGVPNCVAFSVRKSALDPELRIVWIPAVILLLCPQICKALLTLNVKPRIVGCDE